MRSVTCLAALAAGALILSDAPAAAAGDPSSAPPPPKTAAETAAPISSAPPAANNNQLSGSSAVKIAYKSGDLIYRAGTSGVIQSLPNEVARGSQALRIGGHVISAADVGICVAQGDFADATRKSAAWGINTALGTACALTGPGVVPCGILLTAAQICSEVFLGTSIGGFSVRGWEALGREVASPLADSLAEFKRQQDAMRAAHRASIEGTRLSNESYAAAAAMQPAPYSPSTTPYDDGGAAFIGALMTGIATFNTAPAPSPSSSASPSAPSAPPTSGCSANSDSDPNTVCTAN